MNLFRLHEADTDVSTNYQLLVQPEPLATNGKSLLKFRLVVNILAKEKFKNDI